MWKLASRNLFRQKGRTALTLTAIALGVVSLVLSGGFVEDIFTQLREATVQSGLGHLQIYKAGYYRFGRRAPHEYMITAPDEVTGKFRDLPSVRTVMPRVNFAGLLTNGRTTFPVIGEGFDPDREAEPSRYVILSSGHRLQGGRDYEIMLGDGVANALKLKVGDHVTLLVNTPDGALNTLDFQVVGIFRTLSKDYDDRAVRIPLSTAQELMATRAVHSLVLALDNTGSTDEVASLLERRLPPQEYEIKKWYELSDFYRKTVDLYRRHFGVLRLIILGMVLLSVANSVNLTVYERRGEIGTLMALGNHAADVFKLLLTEHLILGIVGSTIGVLAGSGLAVLISAFGIPMPPMPNTNIGYTARIRLVPEEIVLGFLIGFSATLLAALWPARRATRLPVVEALAHNN